MSKVKGKNTKATARAHAHVITTLNVIGLLNCPITNCPITNYPITNCPITIWQAN